MKFSKVIGKIDPKLVAKAEELLSRVFLELATRYTNDHTASKIGGDPLLFSLLYPIEHVCTLNIKTAATDGKRFYWNPKFILKQHPIGLRIVCAHEAWHALYMHPQRRGHRNPKLWNIAVDYIVNGTVMDDFAARKLDPKEYFTKYLGKYMTLEQYAEMLKDPTKPVKGFEDVTPSASVPENTKLPHPMEDRDLTDEEKKELERHEKKVKFYFADPALSDEMKRPEKIYEYLYNLLPKCPKCGKVGVYPPNKPKKQRGKSNQKDQDQNQDQDQDQDSSCSPQPSQGKGKGCDHCGGGHDVFGMGDTLDDHMDADESEEKMAQRISDAIDTAKRLAGHVPASLEEELGKLTAPKISWQDIIRARLLKARAGNGRNDWTRFRSRPMFTGLMVPKRKNYFAKFGCLLDTSGSMSRDDMAFGLSQLCSLDDRSEGTIVPADATIYWDQATKIRKANSEEITKVKVVGRGGTKYAEFFSDYEKNIGKCDFLIVITDGFLDDVDIANMTNPGIDVIWLVTSGATFKAPFGRVFDLKS